MLMHGGTMTSGRLCTVGVVASYWMSSISALRNTTLPGVTARLRPTANARSSVIVIRPRRASSARLRSPCHEALALGRDRPREHVRIGRREVRRRDRVDVLARRELEALLVGGRQRRETREVAQVLGVREVRLHEQREVRLLAPRARVEAPVARRRRDEFGQRAAGGRRVGGRLPRAPAVATAGARPARRRPPRPAAARRAARRARRAAAGRRADRATTASTRAAPAATRARDRTRTADRADREGPSGRGRRQRRPLREGAGVGPRWYRDGAPGSTHAAHRMHIVLIGWLFVIGAMALTLSSPLAGVAFFAGTGRGARGAPRVARRAASARASARAARARRR